MALDMNAAVKITASVNGQQAVDQLRGSMDRLSSTAASLAKTFAAGFIGFQAVQAVGQFAMSIVNAADDMNDMATKTGLTVEQLSELDYAAKTSGSSIEEVTSAMAKLAVKATDAATGSKSAKIAFEALGISVTDSSGRMKTQLQLFEEVADALNQISDPTLKAAMSVELFGKSGANLLPLIKDMQSARKEARELGITVSSDFAKASDEFNDNVTKMSALSSSLAKTILNQVIPALNSMMTEMQVGLKVFGSFGSAMWNIGTSNPFLSLADNAKKYNKQVEELEQSLIDLAGKQNEGTNYQQIRTKQRIQSLQGELETARKLAEYYNIMSGKGTPAAPTPSGDNDKRVATTLERLSKLKTANSGLTDAQKEAKRQEEERARILQQLSDSVFKLSEGEDALTIQKLKSLGASAKEIEQAETLISQRDILNDAAERQKELEQKIDETRKAFLKEGEERMRAQIQAAEELETASTSVWESTRTPLEKYNSELERLQQLYDAGGISAETFARAQTKALEDLKAVGSSVFNETRTPLEKYNIELEKLDELLKNGAISFETWQRGAENARKQLEETGKTGDSVFKELEGAILGFGKSSTDAFVEFVSGAKVSFEDLAMSVLKDIAKMALYMTVTKPLFSWLGGFIPNANGNAFMDGNIVPFANGGVVTGPTIFPMANGAGLMGEAGPEAIMPLQRTPSGKLGVIAQGSGNTNNVTVNVNVESGQSSTQGDGQQANLLGGYIAKAVQAELLKQKRPGGVLFAGA
jgi:lambda family phage tail tape measure protein